MGYPEKWRGFDGLDRGLDVADPEETALRRAQSRSLVRPRFDYDPEFLFQRRKVSHCLDPFSIGPAAISAHYMP